MIGHFLRRCCLRGRLGRCRGARGEIGLDQVPRIGLRPVFRGQSCRRRLSTVCTLPTMRDCRRQEYLLVNDFGVDEVLMGHRLRLPPPCLHLPRLPPRLPPHHLHHHYHRRHRPLHFLHLHPPPPTNYCCAPHPSCPPLPLPAQAISVKPSPSSDNRPPIFSAVPPDNHRETPD